MTIPLKVFVSLVTVLSLLLSACVPTPEPAPTPTPSPVPSVPPVPSSSPVPSLSPTPSPQPPSPTETMTSTPSDTPTATPSATKTKRPTARPQPTLTPTLIPTATLTPLPNCPTPEFFDPFLNRCRLDWTPVPEGDLDRDGDGYTPNGGDCDDNNSNIHPGANDPMDDVDQNCNGDKNG